jgi:hypothetical protein
MVVQREVSCKELDLFVIHTLSNVSHSDPIVFAGDLERFFARSFSLVTLYERSFSPPQELLDKNNTGCERQVCQTSNRAFAPLQSSNSTRW